MAGMRTYYYFLKGNFKPVCFGWLLAFFSSFGQTFFISLFVPPLLREFGFTRASFGMYYSAATLLASIMFLKVGHVIDHQPLRPFTVKTTLLLAGSCIFLSAAVHPAMALVALAGLRLGGQSLMPHISSSVMSRQFDRDRGKALSLSSLGYSSGEIVFPVLIGALLGIAGWRTVTLVPALLLTAVLLPLLKKVDMEAMDSDASENPGGGGARKKAVFRALVRKRNFWIISLPTWFLSLTITGMFFYQYLLAEERQWSTEWYAVCFAGFGLAKVLFLIYGGTLIDRFSARKIFPYFLAPSIIGFAVLAFVTGKISPVIFLPLLGITLGMSGIISSAVIAEVYGVGNIATIRSLFGVVMVIGASAGPLIYGLLLDADYSFRFIAVASSAALVLISLSNTLLTEETP